MTIRSSPTRTSSGAFQKRLVGVQSTPELQRLLRQAASSVDNDDEWKDEFLGEQQQSTGSSLNQSDARQVLAEFSRENGNSSVLPIEVIRAMNSVLSATQRTQLEAALQQTKLAFSSPPDDSEQPAAVQKHRQRMERLRLKQEERNYGNLTRNLGKERAVDEVTTKSMTYAASIGLNMIIAPLSFGTLMYFFAGSLLDYIWGGDDPKNTEIKRVIAGVVSGVAMLFIEMILFVIRTNEMDKAMRRKKKRSANKTSPFGYYNATTSKTYKDE